MHPSLKGISDRILQLALAALKRANTDAVYFDPGMEHRNSLAPLAAAHAGELLIKALIAKEHPLLLFKNIGEKKTNDEIDLEWLLKNGRTHDFATLPSILWAASGIPLPDPESFKLIAERRNQVQHFVDSDGDGVQFDCLNFIYLNIDPLLYRYFGKFACQYHEDQFDDYVIGCLLSCEIKFTVPHNIEFTEIDPSEQLHNSSEEYRDWALKALNISKEF